MKINPVGFRIGRHPIDHPGAGLGADPGDASFQSGSGRTRTSDKPMAVSEDDLGVGPHIEHQGGRFGAVQPAE